MIHSAARITSFALRFGIWVSLSCLAACSPPSEPVSNPVSEAANPLPEQTPATTYESTSARVSDAEQLLFGPPAGWQAAVNISTPHFRRAVFVPTNSPASADTSELIVIEGFPTAGITATQSDPLEYLQALGEHERAICKDFADQNTFAGEERGFATNVRLFVCGNRAGKAVNRLSLLKAIRGTDMFYLVARQYQTPDAIFATEQNAQSASAQMIARWSLDMRSIGMCSTNRTGIGACGEPKSGE